MEIWRPMSMPIRESAARATGVVFMAGFLVIASFVSALLPAEASAKNHTWRFHEVFSNADGTIQFIELMESAGSTEESQFAGSRLDSNGQTYIFPSNLSGSTANKQLLIATQGFANLPGAPTPDFIIPDSFFTSNDLLRYSLVFDAFFTQTVPFDGTMSANRNLTTGVVTTGPNSPTNFAGVTGQVDASPPNVPSLDLLGWGAVVITCTLIGAASAHQRRGRRLRSLPQD